MCVEIAEIAEIAETCCTVVVQLRPDLMVNGSYGLRTCRLAASVWPFFAPARLEILRRGGKVTRYWVPHAMIGGVGTNNLGSLRAVERRERDIRCGVWSSSDANVLFSVPPCLHYYTVVNPTSDIRR